ncbi:MAG: hypothetical protein ACI4F7_03590 [Acutalibacteraceae bacterium]
MKINSNIPADKAMGFEIYHFAWNPRNKVDMLDKYTDMGFMNHFQLPADDFDRMRKIAAAGGKFWAYAHIGLYSKNVDGKIIYGLDDDYRQKIADYVQMFKKEGIWDAIIGFEYDEPMLQSTNELVEKVSAEFAKYGKRQLAIFSYYEIIEGSHPSSNDPEYGKEGHIITSESCRFFTDVGFDLYGTADYDEHAKVLSELKRRIGRDDVHIWLVPCTWSIFNRFGQEHALNHLNMCYKLLMEQEHPGGLTCYNWHSFENKGESLDWLLDERNESRWTNLESRMLEIANEIINTPLK